MKIHKLISLLFVRKIDDKIIRTNKYVTIDIYIDNVNSNCNFAIFEFITKIYLVNNLIVNLFLEMNVLEL